MKPNSGFLASSGEASFSAVNAGLTVVGAQRAGFDTNMIVVGTLALLAVEGLALLG